MNLIVKQEIVEICSTLDQKTIKNLSIDVLLRLLDKIEDLDNYELDAMLLELKHSLSTSIVEQGNTASYRKVFTAIQRKLVNDYKLHQRGTLQRTYLVLGISLGTGLGVAIAINNSAMMAVGIGAGLALGSGIGAQKEQLADKENRLY